MMLTDSSCILSDPVSRAAMPIAAFHTLKIAGATLAIVHNIRRL